ncbi:hypothetical protein [Chitinophaga barathri]|uniref:Uncharacterized protein n=1 Tax=Chitinophaga barathri TaxID=1647451 RepID=A0A3N4M7N2_9BACT|nr:hypothetical protein [Chitinophaga barathri]RPD39534.1 hypothetical protein EG028_20685 [Chitinophaga barathri]
MQNLDQFSVATGLTTTILVFLLILIRQKRCDKSDIGSLAATFVAGSNIPAAIYFCYYVFDPDPPALMLMTKLAGCGKYISFAGLLTFLLCITTLWASISSAYKIVRSPDAATGE